MIMLIAVTVMPIIFNMLTDVPEGTSPAAAPASAATTFIVIAALALRATGVWRLWMPLIGLAAGCVVASFFGLYDIESVLAASWVGIPSGGWPGFDLEFGPTFWGLLPAFVFVTLIGAIETIGDSIAIQRVAWRKPRAVDFRAVQGAVAADGAGNLLSGLAGTVPNTTYSTSIAITELTGVAARSVGVWIGIVFVIAAFLPTVSALLLAIPSPVVAAYVTVLLSLLFVLGMRIVVQGGVDYRKATIAGTAFWVGVGFQNQAIFADSLGEWWGALLGNGMTAGGLTAIVLTVFTELTGPRRKRIETELTVEALPEVIGFLREFASGRSWSTDVDSAALLGRRGGAPEPGRAADGRQGGRQATSARNRARQPQVGGAGVRRRARGREPRGSDGPPDGTRRRGAGRARDLASAAAPLRVIGVSPAVPRHRHRPRCVWRATGRNSGLHAPRAGFHEPGSEEHPRRRMPVGRTPPRRRARHSSQACFDSEASNDTRPHRNRPRADRLVAGKKADRPRGVDGLDSCTRP